MFLHPVEVGMDFVLNGLDVAATSDNPKAFKYFLAVFAVFLLGLAGWRAWYVRAETKTVATVEGPAVLLTGNVAPVPGSAARKGGTPEWEYQGALDITQDIVHGGAVFSGRYRDDGRRTTPAFWRVLAQKEGDLAGVVSYSVEVIPRWTLRERPSFWPGGEPVRRAEIKNLTFRLDARDLSG